MSGRGLGGQAEQASGTLLGHRGVAGTVMCSAGFLGEWRAVCAKVFPHHAVFSVLASAAAVHLASYARPVW